MEETNQILSLIISSPARRHPVGAFLIKKMGECAKRIGFDECERVLREECYRHQPEQSIRNQVVEATIELDCFLRRFEEIHREITGKNL